MIKFKFTGFDKMAKEFRSDFMSGKAEFGYGENSGTHPETGTPYEKIAAIMRFGASKNKLFNTKGGNPAPIPSRDFWDKAISEFKINTSEIEHDMMQHEVFRTVDVLKIIMYNLGIKIRDVIEDWENPKNAEYTVKKKGFNDPLVWTQGLAKAAKQQGGIKIKKV